MFSGEALSSTCRLSPISNAVCPTLIKQGHILREWSCMYKRLRTRWETFPSRCGLASHLIHVTHEVLECYILLASSGVVRLGVHNASRSHAGQTRSAGRR